VFTTREVIDFSGLIHVMHTGYSEPLQRDRLLISIHSALEHRKDALTASTWLTEAVIAKVTELSEPVVTIETLVHLAHQTIKSYDQAASTIYAVKHGASHIKNLV
jgi:transcriptional regulator NrdR family protein